MSTSCLEFHVVLLFDRSASVSDGRSLRKRHHIYSYIDVARLLGTQKRAFCIWCYIDVSR
jgi:hypothetical protein